MVISTVNISTYSLKKQENITSKPLRLLSSTTTGTYIIKGFTTLLLVPELEHMSMNNVTYTKLYTELVIKIIDKLVKYKYI